MKYVVTTGESRVIVELGAEGMRVDDQVVSAILRDVPGTPVRLVEVDGIVHRLVVRRGATRGSYRIWMDGYTYDVEALDERTRAIRDMSAAVAEESGPAPLVAPMPGLIVRVTVQVGVEVRAGEGLVVMEAMKMENELRAPAAGRVTAVHVEPGVAVEKGAVLVELE
ncbi:MAG TPA: biotin/lipoyl-containing protein [Gemmatimonadaceae bacterium]|nr:biotin/lipoyl-containing protein [Gemmatimonadaceae bacterium]